MYLHGAEKVECRIDKMHISETVCLIVCIRKVKLMYQNRFNHISNADQLFVSK